MEVLYRVVVGPLRDNGKSQLMLRIVSELREVDPVHLVFPAPAEPKDDDDLAKTLECASRAKCNHAQASQGLRWPYFKKTGSRLLSGRAPATCANI